MANFRVGAVVQKAGDPSGRWFFRDAGDKNHYRLSRGNLGDYRQKEINLDDFANQIIVVEGGDFQHDWLINVTEVVSMTRDVARRYGGLLVPLRFISCPCCGRFYDADYHYSCPFCGCNQIAAKL